MSIQTELTRITNAKAAIKTAIEGKGVTVPDGTLLDGMAALIESIETGSGGVSGFQTASGIITLAEDTNTLDISALLGFAPLPSKAWSFSVFANRDLPPLSKYHVIMCSMVYFGRTDSSTGEKQEGYVTYYRTSSGSDIFTRSNFLTTYSEGVITLDNSSYAIRFKSGINLNYIYHGEE